MDFTKAFGIRDGHTLHQTSERSKGTLLQDDYWEHEERDRNGVVVARYSSWSCTSIKPPFVTRSGYKKVAPDGSEIETRGELDI